MYEDSSHPGHSDASAVSYTGHTHRELTMDLRHLHTGGAHIRGGAHVRGGAHIRGGGTRWGRGAHDVTYYIEGVGYDIII